METPFATKHRPERPTYIAPDGSEIRLLLDVAGGGMAIFDLPPGVVSKAVMHQTVEEIWYVISGAGQMWRKQDWGDAETVDLFPGVCVTVPLGTHFQFRASAASRLSIVGVTMPPWPGEAEAIHVRGEWDDAG